MDPRRTVYAEGALAVRGGRILAVGPRQEVAGRYRAPRTLDAGGGLLLPGLIDGHTHLPMTLFRGLADDLSLHTWLEQHLWPAEHQFLNPETV
jgi:5-methylthioadenosine/S-adenosylhomocysteine deaminase